MARLVEAESIDEELPTLAELLAKPTSAPPNKQLRKPPLFHAKRPASHKVQRSLKVAHVDSLLLPAVEAIPRNGERRDKIVEPRKEDWRLKDYVYSDDESNDNASKKSKSTINSSSDEDDEPIRDPARRRRPLQTLPLTINELSLQNSRPLTAEDDSHILRYTPPRNPSKIIPASPSKLPSPRKPPPLPSPHRPSIDAFWNASEINDLHDAHSPRKLPPTSTPRTRKPDTANAKAVASSLKAFNATKHSLAASFLTTLDDTLTSGTLARLTAPSGIALIWSARLNTTAGRAHWRREATSSADGSQERHIASIELASKVIRTPTQLRNVLAHEYCHLATFMVSRVTDAPHGAAFKSWAGRASAAFKQLDVQVTTKHDFEIVYRYAWRCGGCGGEVERHSRSVDVSRHRCGRCKGVLVQVRPMPRDGGEGEWKGFVRENYKEVREELGGSPMKVVMAEVAKRYRARIVEVGASQDEGEVDSVVRSLDFLSI